MQRRHCILECRSAQAGVKFQRGEFNFKTPQVSGFRIATLYQWRCEITKFVLRFPRWWITLQTSSISVIWTGVKLQKWYFNFEQGALQSGSVLWHSWMPSAGTCLTWLLRLCVLTASRCTCSMRWCQRTCSSETSLAINRASYMYRTPRCTSACYRRLRPEALGSLAIAWMHVSSSLTSRRSTPVGATTTALEPVMSRVEEWQSVHIRSSQHMRDMLGGSTAASRSAIAARGDTAH